MKIRYYIFTLVLLLLYSCDASRLQPCCRFKPGYGSFERKRTLVLTQKNPNEVAVYKVDKYIIIVDKSKAINDLSKYIKQDSLSITKFNFASIDTLDLTYIKVEGFWRVKKFITKEIEHHDAVIIDLHTGEKLEKLIRRKVNYQTGTREGRGGIEYIDPNTNFVIISRDFWFS